MTFLLNPFIISTAAAADPLALYDIDGEIEDQTAGAESYSIEAGVPMGLVISGTHTRSGGTATAGTPELDTGAPWITMHSSARYDTIGTSDGACAYFRSTANDAGTLTCADVNWQEISAVFPAEAYVVQSATAVAQADDSVSVSLSSAPTGPVYVWLFVGGQQSTMLPVTAPSGWTEEFSEELLGASSYWQFGWVYSGTDQTFTHTLPTGATTNGGWSAMIVELGEQTIEFSDDFNRTAGSGILGSDWSAELSGGVVSINSEAVDKSGSTTSIRIADAYASIHDFTVTVDLSSSSSDFYLIGRNDSGTTSLGNYYMGGYEGGNYVIYRYNPSGTIIASTAGSAFGAATVSLAFSGDTIDLIVNGSSVLSTTDSNVTGYGFGFRAYQTSHRFDNYRVTS